MSRYVYTHIQSCIYTCVVGMYMYVPSILFEAHSMSLLMLRPGLIGAHSSTGHANLQDWVCWLVRSIVKLGHFPVGPGCDDKMIYCVPVEQVARAISFFSLEYEGNIDV